MNNNDNLDTILLKRTINYLINRDGALKGVVIKYFKEEIEHLKECFDDILYNDMNKELNKDDFKEINKYRMIINKMSKIIHEIENNGGFYE